MTSARRAEQNWRLEDEKTKLEQKESLRFRVIAPVILTLAVAWRLFTTVLWRSSDFAASSAKGIAEIIVTTALIATALALWIRVWRPRA